MKAEFREYVITCLVLVAQRRMSACVIVGPRLVAALN
jgi:hypothetical protein